MIVSHRYRFIYLRTEKTASTALTDALSRLVAAEDQVVRSFRGAWVDRLPVRSGFWAGNSGAGGQR